MDVRTAQQALADLAVHQHGVFGTRQLTAAGIDGWHVSQLVRRGSVERLAPQVYRMAGVPPSWRGDLSAGLHALGPGSLVSHRAAAQLHQFDEFRYDDLEFTVRRRRRGAFFLEATIHTSLVLQPVDVDVIDGLRVTSPVRTVIDLAGVRISDRRLEAAVDTVVRRRLATLEDIADRLAALRGKGRRGVRRLERVLVTSGGHSFLEREFLKLLERVGLPQPIPQVDHRVDGIHVARVDFLYPDHGIVVEVSGGRGHSSAAERAKDARRRNELQRLGRLVLEFTYEDVTQRAPYVVQTVRSALTNPFVSR